MPVRRRDRNHAAVGLEIVAAASCRREGERESAKPPVNTVSDKRASHVDGKSVNGRHILPRLRVRPAKMSQSPFLTRGALPRPQRPRYVSSVFHAPRDVTCVLIRPRSPAALLRTRIARPPLPMVTFGSCREGLVAHQLLAPPGRARRKRERLGSVG
jgi:hypothetical protein